jgi:small subunit ribosomal protein S1
MVENKIMSNSSNPGNVGNDQMSMAELLEDSFSIQEMHQGDILTGRIVRKTTSELMVSVGQKSEGVVTSRELEQLPQDYLDELKEGDEVLVYVVRPESEEGHIILSISRAQAEKDWLKAEELYDKGEIFKGKVSSFNKGGLIINFGLVRGFVPGSQLVSASAESEREAQWASLMGKTLNFKIIEFDRKRNRLIMSEKAAEQEMRKGKKAELMSSLKEGDITKGRVISLADFGAFIDLGGADGLIHLSELSWTRISHPSEVLKIGDEVTVKVIKIEEERDRIGLSLKQVQPEPWSNIFDTYEVGQVVNAKISKITDFGAFAKLDDAFEGLIHISELSNANITHPKEVVKEGQDVQVTIIRIDPERRRIGLSLKQTEGEDDWEAFKSQDAAEPASGEEAAPDLKEE